MKIRLISDLHYDKYDDIQELFEKLNVYFSKINPDEEILIVAGDIGFATEKNTEGETVLRKGYIEVLKYLKSRWKYIILIPGNHEYYTSTVPIVKTNDLISNECEKMGIEFLNKDIVEMFGITFIGCTLWSPMTEKAYAKLNKKNWSFIEYENLISLHDEHKKWLENTLEKYNSKNTYNEKIIVITHYLPSPKLIHYKYNHYQPPIEKSAYCSDLSKICGKYDHLMRFWFYGHSHMSVFRRLYNTCLYFNHPIGNPWENGDSMIIQESLPLE
jgi:UDP-2,3-diacylglucosamine pyrophosphatase LpxH